MNIKDFLLDNYIYILIVIILIVITIIGFLADKNRNKKKDESKEAPAEQPTPNYALNQGTPMNYQPQQNQMLNNQPMNMNNPLNMPNMNMNMNMGMQQPAQFPTMDNNQVSPIQPQQPVDTLNQSPMPEPIYQPISEQQPTFNQPVVPVEPMINNVVNEPMVGQQNIQGEPSPINYTQPVVQPISTPVQENIASIPQPVPSPTMNFNQSVVQPASQPTISEAINQNQVNNVPVSPIPTPQPNTIPNPITPPQPASPQPISFVFGPQDNNNNQNM